MCAVRNKSLWHGHRKSSGLERGKNSFITSEQLSLCLNVIYLTSLSDTNVSKFTGEYKAADTAEHKPFCIRISIN